VEVGASKGAFYHYFDSKQALLQAVVDRLVQSAAVVMGRVLDEDKPAIDKLRAYFQSIASYKSEQMDFLLALMRVWYSDDNAIVRQKIRRQSWTLVAPQIATIIRQGIAEGAFTLSDPDQMARVVLALILDAGDEAGEMWLARQAGQMEYSEIRDRFTAWPLALERVLGIAPGRLELVDESILRLWFEDVFTTHPDVTNPRREN